MNLRPRLKEPGPSAKSGAGLFCFRGTGGTVEFNKIAQVARNFADRRARWRLPVSFYETGLAVLNVVLQSLMHFHFAVVFDQAEFPKPVHEYGDPGASRSDHFGEQLVVHLYGDWIRCMAGAT